MINPSTVIQAIIQTKNKKDILAMHVDCKVFR